MPDNFADNLIIGHLEHILLLICITLAIEEYKPEKIIAVRYEKHEEDESIWDTDYVMNFNTMKMCIRLERSYNADAIGISPKFSTPHFITLLEQKGYLASDDNLPMTREPIDVNDTNIDLLADVINQKRFYKVPIIYVSKLFSNADPIDVKLLASRVKGTAHVLVLEDTDFGYTLREKCDSRNEFNGAVGIYFPSTSIEHKRYLCHTNEG